MRLRLKQENEKINQEIRQYLTDYRPTTELTIDDYQSNKNLVSNLRVLLAVFQKYQPTLQTLDGIVQLPLTPEFIEFQSKWVTSICDYRERLGEQGLRKLRRIKLPITQSDVIRFTKMTKRHKPVVPFLMVVEGFVVGSIVVGFLLFVYFYLT